MTLQNVAIGNGPKRISFQHGISRSTKASIKHNYKKPKRGTGSNSSGGDKMDVNLTGTIAENLVYNLKPQLWNSALLFAVVTVIITSAITFCTVHITNKAAEEREERNRNEERRRTLREERKQVYTQFIKYVVKTDIVNSNIYQNRDPPINREQYLDEYTGSISALKLLSPEIADCIINIHDKKYQFKDESFQEEWNKISNDIKTEIIPLMIAELNTQPLRK